jgi:hypothetical protein
MRLPTSAAVLGTGLDLTFEDDQGNVKKMDLRGLTIAADLDEKTIWIVPTPKKRTENTTAFPVAARLRKRWSGLKPEHTLLAKVPESASSRRIGHIRTIGYRSNKWDGKAKDYEHKYDSRPVIVESGQVLKVRGGKQRVTPRGITG